MSNRLVLALVAALLSGATAPALALCRKSECGTDGRQKSGAVYRVCLPEPSCWNGELVVFAHGFVDSGEPLAIPEDQLRLGRASLPRLANALGYAFATTSYRTNGLAVLEGVEDVTDLVEVFTALHRRPARTFLVGASAGGQVTALALERTAGAFDAGLAACAPIGDFRAMVDHAGDFRAVFDYLFPGVIPGTLVDVPPELRREWFSVYVPLVREALAARPDAAAALFAVTPVPYQPALPGTRAESAVTLLTHGVFVAPDATERLGGSPYDNTMRVYRGSADDAALNAGVRRYAADPAALAEIAARYETTGALAGPLVTLNTPRDPLVPYRQALLYGRKVRAAGAGALHQQVSSFQYGHCAFTAFDGLRAFATLLSSSGAPVPADLEAALADRAARRRLLSRVRPVPTPFRRQEVR